MKRTSVNLMFNFLNVIFIEDHEKVVTAVNEEITTLMTEKKELKSTLRRNNSKIIYNNIRSSIHRKLQNKETSIKNRHERKL